MATKMATARREPSIFTKAMNYLKESYAETRRATWPSWEDIRRLTTAVFAGVIFVTLYVYIVDSILAYITKTLFGLGR
ncbi:MAG: preprotein translocase subunit SecE [Armatimonadota bacterium]